jgi:hypothetical protein
VSAAPPGRARAALAVALAAGVPGALAAAPGDPDPGFDIDGRQTFGYGGECPTELRGYPGGGRRGRRNGCCLRAAGPVL